MLRRTPRTTRYDSPFPTTTRFRSSDARTGAPRRALWAGDDVHRRRAGHRRDPRARLEARQMCTAPPTSVRAELVEASSGFATRSEEHTSELQSLMRTSHAVFCLNQKT